MFENGALRLVCLLSLLFASATASAEEARLDQPPRLLRFVEASPPPALAQRGAAEVVLTIDVDEKGKVVKTEITRPAGDGFDEAALEAVKQFEFSPGMAGGKPVPVRITYSYKFALRAPSPSPEPTPL